MLDFSSIVPHLQAHIAEKMDYFDQMEFEFSSKLGKYTMNATKIEGIVDVTALRLEHNGDVLFDVKESLCYFQKWTKFSPLVRFKVDHLLIWNTASLNFIFDHADQFLGSDVLLRYHVIMLSEHFNKIAKIFEIKSVDIRTNIVEPALFSLQSFVNLDFFQSFIDIVDNENLLEVKAKWTTFHFLIPNSDRISVVTNLYLKEWFQNERVIETFHIHQYEEEPINVKKLLADLSYTTVRKFTKDVIVMFLKGHHYTHRLLKDDGIYSLDRGDQKMLIVASANGVTVLEYEELSETIEITCE